MQGLATGLLSPRQADFDNLCRHHSHMIERTDAWSRKRGDLWGSGFPFFIELCFVFLGSKTSKYSGLLGCLPFFCVFFAFARGFHGFFNGLCVKKWQLGFWDEVGGFGRFQFSKRFKDLKVKNFEYLFFLLSGFFCFVVFFFFSGFFFFFFFVKSF